MLWKKIDICDAFALETKRADSNGAYFSNNIPASYIVNRGFKRLGKKSDTTGTMKTVPDPPHQPPLQTQISWRTGNYDHVRENLYWLNKKTCLGARYLMRDCDKTTVDKNEHLLLNLDRSRRLDRSSANVKTMYLFLLEVTVVAFKIRSWIRHQCG